MTRSPTFEVRIRRAEELERRYPFAAEILQFFQLVARFQGALCGQIPRTCAGQPVTPPATSVRSELNLVLLLPHFPSFLELVKQRAPKPLSETASTLERNGSSAWIAALADYWALGGRRTQKAEDARSEFLCRGFLQPLAELVAAGREAAPQPIAGLVCPLCEARPVAGVLRPEGEGGKRFLVCSFCGHEWEFRRILCAGCGETREEQLPVFVAEQLAHIRVEACDTCRRFLRTIDLTKDGHAVPVVDDLAAIPLTLWAQEHGYTRIEPNLLGA